jgi:tRNA1Val (adenine37-N6)-methyltransferase
MYVIRVPFLYIMKNVDEIKKLGKATSVFYFKQFSVKDDRSTMKVGTDAILLGIATDVSNARSILEVGTGCGVIALVLAQRSSAMIDAIDVDDESIGQALENVASSPWKDRVNVIPCALQDYRSEKKYDLIVSNPPYFSGTYRSHLSKRNMARHNDRLTFEELIRYSMELLEDDGSLWVVLPVKESLQFISIAEDAGLSVHYMLKIIPKAGKEPNRVIVEMKTVKTDEIRLQSLTHWDADGSWAEEFKKFTADFYIDF